MNTLENGEFMNRNVYDLNTIKDLIDDVKKFKEFKETVDYKIIMILRELTSAIKKDCAIKSVKIEVTLFDKEILKEVVKELKDREFQVKIKDYASNNNWSMNEKYIIVSGW